MRSTFVNTMIECARKDEKVVLLMAEVGFSVVEPFEKEFPNRFFNTGIAEQNLVLTASGMAMAGMCPVAYSMSSFLPSRAYELIKVSVCYQNLPVVLVSTGTGVSYSQMGSTHHAIEESALMRSLPNMNVLFPCDKQELKDALVYALSENKPYYISYPKLPAPQVESHPFIPNKAVQYKEGKDGAILAVGFSVQEACKAADLLKEKNIDLAVYGMHTVKPLDKEMILEAGKTGNVFVVDEHQSCCGIGAEVAKVLLENKVKIERFKEFSINDTFLDCVRSYNEMIDLYGINSNRIAVSIEAMY